MTNISVGIIGCGSMAEHRHAPEYAAHHQVGEIVFYDRNQDRAERLANKFKGRSVHRIEDLFNDPRIHLISDCSSNETHMFNTIEALNKGKHVLCEKPMANTIEDAKAMVEASNKTGKRLFIAHNQRFVRAHQRAKDIVDSGSLGKVLSFKTTFSHRGPEHWGTTKSNATWFFKKERSYSGVIGDMGIHKMDLLRYILSDELEEVSAFGGALHKRDENHEPIEVYDHVTSILRTKRGVLGDASFSWTNYGKEENSMTLYLEKGAIHIGREECPLIVEEYSGDTVRYDLESQKNSGVIDHVIHCLTHNVSSIISGEEGLESLKVVAAMKESAESRSICTIQ